MVHREELDNYCNKFLCVKNFKDYGPNGLQIEGSDTIDKIISGVSANLDLIGIFWDNESNLITGAKRKKIALLMNNNINLFGYHLPLDDHPEVGNNIELGRILGIKKMRPVEDSYLWQGELKTDLKSFSSLIEKELGRTPQLFGEMKESVNKIAWCTGGAQGFIDEAIKLKVDLYLSGEVSERTPAAAKENGIAFISAGHHATERYGVQSLCNHLSAKFKLQHQFIDVDNSV